MALTMAVLTVLGSILALLVKIWPTRDQEKTTQLDEQKERQDALIRRWIDDKSS